MCTQDAHSYPLYTCILRVSYHLLPASPRCLSFPPLADKAVFSSRSLNAKGVSNFIYTSAATLLPRRKLCARLLFVNLGWRVFGISTSSSSPLHPRPPSVRCCQKCTYKVFVLVKGASISLILLRRREHRNSRVQGLASEFQAVVVPPCNGRILNWPGSSHLESRSEEIATAGVGFSV